MLEYLPTKFAVTFKGREVWEPVAVNLDIPIYFKISVDMLILMETRYFAVKDTSLFCNSSVVFQ